jgi:hypothetical protein
LRNKVVLQLADNISHALGYVQDVEQFTRLTQLKRAIEDIRPLVEDTANFIVTYSASDGISTPFLLVCSKLMHFIEAAMDPVLSSSERDQIDRLTTRFEQFKQQFDRGISVQSIVTMDQLLNSISE